ncbi:MAG: lipid-A-disaccharide synthase [Bryobacteraceae bacterium]
MNILISAGEASGDLYASALKRALSAHWPEARFYGCAGPRLRDAGVEPVIRAESLNVVGLVEVVRHIPRIYGEFRKLVRAAEQRRPDLAILTDSPDFHLRLAPKLKALGVPVVYLIAPQAWAWRKGRIPAMRRNIDHLLCIFPFEEEFFRSHGVNASYIGHPLTRIAQPSRTRLEFLSRHGLPADKPLVLLLPGSRPGEIARHLPIVTGAVERMRKSVDASFVMATPGSSHGLTFLTEPLARAHIQHIEGETWDALAAADLALAASGTVTIEAAILGAPLIAFYKVSPWSWWMGRYLVQVPYYSMVNLVAGRAVAPELIQDGLSEETLATEGLRLLNDASARLRMQTGLQEITRKLATGEDPMERAAHIVTQIANKGSVHE